MMACDGLLGEMYAGGRIMCGGGGGSGVDVSQDDGVLCREFSLS